MKVYFYDPRTGEYLGSGDADQNPMEPGEYLIPAFSVLDAPPPVSEHQCVVRRGEAWAMVTDRRGEMIHNAAQRQQTPMPELGEPPAGWAFGELPPLASDLFDKKLAAINAAAEQAVQVITSKYPRFEIDTFADQEREARTWLLDNTVATPTLSIIAHGRGIELADLANRVIAKADLFRPFTASVIARRQALEDQLMAIDLNSDDVAVQIDAIDETQLVNNGWVW